MLDFAMAGRIGIAAVAGLLPAGPVSAPLLADAPAGIYALSVARDNPNTPQDERLGGIRSYDFVSGFTLRVFWTDIESGQGQYDFSVIDQAIGAAAAIGRGVNLELLMGEEPQYVLNGSAATYIDHRGGTNPVPWDQFAQQRHAALYTALANHVIPGTAAAPGAHALKHDPTLKSVDASPVGLNYGVRDLNNGIRNHPDYTQQRYVDSIVKGVAASASEFSEDMNFLAFFAFHDAAPGARVDQQILQQLAPLYNHPGQTQLAMFIENFSDDGPVPLPNGAVGPGNNLLTWSGAGGYTMMQALDAWLQHAPDRDAQLDSLNPATGIELGYNTFGTRFFELYAADLDGAANGAVDASGQSIADDLRHWNTLLTTVPEPGAIIAMVLVGMVLGSRRLGCRRR
ncbi:MAG: PEP-CTERM sorting domain-containing protein [Burkholderiales bacterium]|nr:PEP-CTERM sorting domain-containing protein [Phycisphaerae bacterium]